MAEKTRSTLLCRISARLVGVEDAPPPKGPGKVVAENWGSVLMFLYRFSGWKQARALKTGLTLAEMRDRVAKGKAIV